MEFFFNPRGQLLSLSSLSFLAGMAFIRASKKERETFDVPLISSAGKTIIGGSLLFLGILLLTTSVAYNKF